MGLQCHAHHPCEQVYEPSYTGSITQR